MPQKASHRRHGKNRQKHARLKKAKKIAEAVSLSYPARKTGAMAQDEARQLLENAATALNALEIHGVIVSLLPDAVVTDWGYVFRLWDDGPVWETRSRSVAPFPVPDAVPGEED